MGLYVLSCVLYSGLDEARVVVLTSVLRFCAELTDLSCGLAASRTLVLLDTTVCLVLLLPSSPLTPAVVLPAVLRESVTLVELLLWPDSLTYRFDRVLYERLRFTGVV